MNSGRPIYEKLILSTICILALLLVPQMAYGYSSDTLLSITNASVYEDKAMLTICNSGSETGFRLKVENLTKKKTSYKNLKIFEEACENYKIHFQSYFKKYNKPNDLFRFSVLAFSPQSAREVGYTSHMTKFIQYSTYTSTLPHPLASAMNACIGQDVHFMDGKYSLCVGDRFFHSPSGITMELDSYSNNDVTLKLTGARRGKVTLYKNKEMQLLNKYNSKKINVSYKKNESSNYSIVLRITSEPMPVVNCSNFSGKNIEFDLCKGKKFVHSPTGVTAELLRVTPQKIVIRIEALSSFTLEIPRRSTYFINMNNNQENFTIRYVDMISNKARINISSSIGKNCGNSRGGYGLYSGCVGDKIQHFNTGTFIEVIEYNSEYVDLSLTGSKNFNFRLFKNNHARIVTNSGDVFYLTYTKMTAHHGAFVYISQTASYPLDINDFASNSNNSTSWSLFSNYMAYRLGNNVYKVTGNVTNKAGTPLNNASVKILNANNQTLYSRMTNGNGHYSFSSIILSPSNSYKLLVSYNGNSLKYNLNLNEVGNSNTSSISSTSSNNSVSSGNSSSSSSSRSSSSSSSVPTLGEPVSSSPENEMISVAYKQNQYGNTFFSSNNEVFYESFVVHERDNLVYPTNQQTQFSSLPFHFKKDIDNKTVLFANPHYESGVSELGTGLLHLSTTVPANNYRNIGIQVKKGNNYAVYDSSSGSYFLLLIE